MIHSMTGFAARKGHHGLYDWTWDLRSVNGKGLDLRLRMPDWIEGLEAGVRARLSKALSRGSVNLALRVNRAEESGQLHLNAPQLALVLDAMMQVEADAMERGLSLTASTAADVLSLRGVLDTASRDESDSEGLAAALLADIEPLIAAFLDMRATEGKALMQVLGEQLDQVETLVAQAQTLAESRREDMASNLRKNLARVMENTDGADPDRVAQELALIAVKSDVMEELDRLRAHVQAARDLLAAGGAVGRKLDFLMQEFNREANTLCSKAQLRELTTVGLDLKAVIDQMREQVQNVE